MSRPHTPNRLWKYRNRMGFRQKDIADKLKLKCSAMISRWERGKAMPTGDQLLKLSLLYRVVPNELYYEQVKEFEKELFGIDENAKCSDP